MINEQMRCPKCKGEMVQGFVPDYFHGGGAALVGGWFAGQPKKSFWKTTKAPRAEGVPIGAFRCQKCGFLELYSDAKFAAQ
jgi:predicted Zn-ribbon and HTH transcriptional regulator